MKWLWPLLSLLTLSAQADSWRCSSQLVSLGDRTFEVQQRCGEPLQRDAIGYAISANARTEVLIEEWLYGPQNGMYTLLRFEGNRLVRIERTR